MVWLRSIGLRLLTWGLALGTLGAWGKLAMSATEPASARHGLGGVAVALLVGALAAITGLRPAWWSGRAHRRVMLPLGLVLGAPVVGYLALTHAEQQAVFRAGTGVSLGSSPLLMVLGLALTGLVVRSVHGQRHQRHFGLLLRSLGLGGVLVLGALFAVGTGKKILRPSPGLAELPSRVVLGPMVRGAGAVVEPRKNSRETRLDHDWTDVGSESEPLSLHRLCGESACWFAFRRVPLEGEPPTLGTGPITILRAAREELLYLSDGAHSLVFLARTLQPLTGGVAQASGRLTAPWAWLTGAGVVLALIGALQAYRRRAEAWAEVLAGASAGRVEDGWVRFRSDRPDELAPIGLASGSRVIVLPSSQLRTEHYRSSHALAESDVLKGHQGLLLDKAWSNVAAIDALCLALAALAAAPLVAGAALGLVF